MCMYPMVDFYGESRDVMASSAGLYVVTLERIFKQLRDYGVELQEEAIPGLNGASLQRWFNAIRKTLKPATVNSYVVTLNPFLRWAHTIYPDAIPDFSNVLHTVKLPSYDQIPDEEKPKEKYYQDDEIEKLLAVPKHDSALKKRDRAIIATYLATGLRASELCQLTVGSIREYKHGYVRVRRKGGAYKDVDIAEFAYSFIETYLQTRPDADDMKAPLFVTTHGEPCNEHQLYRSMRHRQEAIGTENAVGNHVLRHTFVSSAEKAGGAAVARDLANHKSLVVTNRYDHSSAEQRATAVNNTSIAKILGRSMI